jgi:acyl-coenzyme A synthetase/AMP-(fatty) acid ligase
MSRRQIEEVWVEFDELIETAAIGIPDEVPGKAVDAIVGTLPKNGGTIMKPAHLAL